MSALEYIGATVVGLLGVGVAIALLELAGNLYGGIKGAYRFRAIMARDGGKHVGHWSTIKYGMRAWPGVRYRDGVGEYWQIGGLKVPVDGRDPIERDRWFGA